MHIHYTLRMPETDDLLHQRRTARIHGQWNAERRLRAEVKNKSAKHDRSRWLEDLASSGNWRSIKKLRRGRVAKQDRLRSADGDLASSEMQAETLAEHLETIEWKVRPTTLVPGVRACLGPPLPVQTCNLSMTELRKAIGKIRPQQMETFQWRFSRLYLWNRARPCNGCCNSATTVGILKFLPSGQLLPLRCCSRRATQLIPITIGQSVCKALQLSFSLHF